MAQLQTAIVQSPSASPTSGLPLTISNSVPIPTLQSPHDVLIRVLAIGLNPTDFKMVTQFPKQGNGSGCDFCGTIEARGGSASLSLGTRVCGAIFPYNLDDEHHDCSGAFSQWVVADSRHLLRVPNGWTDVQAAALGAVGWGTAAVAMADPRALGLAGLPSRPVEKWTPVLVHGGATATGLMAIQMLKLSGYAPIAVCSTASASLVVKYGAVGAASYTSVECVETIKAIANGVPIRYALDCITDAQSASICFAALARTGGWYACLENFHESWRTRRAIKTKVVMGFEMQGVDVDLGHDVYSRTARPELHDLGIVWAREMQALLDAGSVKTQPIKELELDNGFEGIIEGLNMLRTGQIRGQKLVARVPSHRE
ncbi:zinc-binding dehydrogenase family oxidoreductase [Melanomma pulvis-pyrius CBS 109.77]|uniref:Zinc-binding dehydrogenase family oxidoreductase n=1 Tax=Melanomma pulvis-pyrius CBS 109.77 TaxID=1314802 RepID=A0A6A6XXW3_9PLEO|nr:zinc-binding dehydrogenase family oxidoreductase [Melanomma pulvis-pyrius CBS 109.77]